MKDLEQLKQQILMEVEQDSAHQLAVATKEQEERINQTNATLAQKEVARKTQLKQLAKNQLEKEKQSLINASKMEVLQVKRSLLNHVFDDVRTILSSWQGETLRMFIQSAVKQLPQEQTILILGELTKDLLSTEDRQELIASTNTLIISNETVAKKAGFVLQQDGIEYNYLFDALIEDLKQEYSSQLAKQAFEA